MLSLILPTYNEAENLSELLPRILSVLSGIPYEVIIVDDDSPDRTWEVAQKFSQSHPEVHVVRRIGRRGLSSAVIEGFLSAKGEVLAVMDADGQHDRGLLPKLYGAVMQEEAGIAIGSRYVRGGSVGGFDERRRMLSRVATWLAIKLCRVKVNDPMSGFFAIDRELFERVLPTLNPKGFKILLDLLVHVPVKTPVVEIPLQFGERLHGKSKLSMHVQLQFIEYLYDVTLGKYISRLPAIFVALCFVIAVVLGSRVWAIRLLYTHGGVRSSVERAMRTVADQKGWLISDMEVVSVTSQRVTIHNRRHSRRRDPVSCYRLSLRDSSLTPCEF